MAALNNHVYLITALVQRPVLHDSLGKPITECRIIPDFIQQQEMIKVTITTLKYMQIIGF